MSEESFQIVEASESHSLQNFDFVQVKLKKTQKCLFVPNDQVECQHWSFVPGEVNRSIFPMSEEAFIQYQNVVQSVDQLSALIDSENSRFEGELCREKITREEEKVNLDAKISSLRNELRQTVVALEQEREKSTSLAITVEPKVIENQPSLIYILRDLADQDVRDCSFPIGFYVVEHYKNQIRIMRAFLDMMMSCLQEDVVVGSMKYLLDIPSVLRQLLIEAKRKVDVDIQSLKNQFRETFGVSDLSHDLAARNFFNRTAQRVLYPSLKTKLQSTTIQELQSCISGVSLMELEDIINNLKSRDELDRSDVTSLLATFRFFGEAYMHSIFSDPPCSLHGQPGDEVSSIDVLYESVHSLGNARHFMVLAPALFYCNSKGEEDGPPRVKGLAFPLILDREEATNKPVSTSLPSPSPQSPPVSVSTATPLPSYAVTVDPLNGPFTVDVNFISAAADPTDLPRVPQTSSRPVESLNFMIQPLLPPVKLGLPNLGNSCYLNSLLQCLMHSSVFERLLFHNFPTEPSVLASSIRNIWTLLVQQPLPLRTTDRARLVQVLFSQLSRLRPTMFRAGEQVDVHTALKEILCLLRMELQSGAMSTTAPTASVPSNDRAEQQQVSLQFWQSHLASPAGRLLEAMFWMRRGVIRCSMCQRETSTFDLQPTLLLDVPIVQTASTTRNIPVIFQRLNEKSFWYFTLTVPLDASVAVTKNLLLKRLQRQLPHASERSLQILFSSLQKVRANDVVYMHLMNTANATSGAMPAELATSIFDVLGKNKVLVASQLLCPYYSGQQFLLDISFAHVHHIQGRAMWQVIQDALPIRLIFSSQADAEANERSLMNTAVRQVVDMFIPPMMYSTKFRLQFLSPQFTPVTTVTKRAIVQLRDASSVPLETFSSVLNLHANSMTTVSQVLFLAVPEAVSVPGPFTLPDAMMHFSREQKQTRRCIGCDNSGCEHTLRYEVWRPSPLLAICVNRLVMTPQGQRVKMDMPCFFPSQLELTDHSTDRQLVYDLCGVSQHLGYADNGHYITTARRPDCDGDGEHDRWRCYNDEFVSDKDVTQVEQRDAYLFFYQLRS